MPLFVRGVLVLVCLVSSVRAQGTAEDYARADGLRARFSGKVFRADVRPRWDADGNGFCYKLSLPNGRREFVAVDAENGKRELAFDHAKLADALGKAWGRELSAERLPIDDLFPDRATKTVVVVTGRDAWRCNLETYEVEKAERPNRPRPTRQRSQRRNGGRLQAQSPDGKWIVEQRDHDLVLRNRDSDEERQLTTDGTEEDRYEERVLWSPDSSRFVARRVRPAEKHTVYFVESSPRGQVQPKLHSQQYLKPGDRIERVRLHLFDVAAAKEIPVSHELFDNPWSIRDLRWQPDSSRFTFLYNQRGHQVLRIVSVDGRSGEARAIVEEKSPTFIDYQYKTWARYLDDTNELVWSSERSGWNHLYLIDAATGEVKNPITSGEWVVRGIDRIDTEKREIWFRASGIHADQDPYHVHFCRVGFDGKNLVVLTAGDGMHEIEFSPDGRFLVDRYSRVDLPPVTELRRVADGELVCELERADVTALVSAGWKPAERFVAKARDDETDIWGVIHRPTNFDPEKRYPVIEKIYAGPHGSFVPKTFTTFHRLQEIAELGFIVVQIDGLGTSNRSKAFHDVCWRNLGDSGFPDRIKWMRAAAAKYPSMDLERVGIYGGSAGGQSSTRAMLAHGDFYDVAVSDCGCHDNRMDKVWWNELWMGWPIGPHYAEQSNVTNAHRLSGKLLLIVGELDRNVDPASTMQVVDALVKADKDFDMLVIPGAGHGSAESRYGRRRRRDYFVRHLMGVEPRRTAASAE